MRHMSRLAVGIVLSVGWVAVPSASGSTVSNGLIAFSTHFVLPFGDRGVGAQIFTVTPNGGAPHQLTHVSSDQDAAAPSWSPSGARIVYESDVTGDMQIWAMRADGSNQHLLFRDRGWDDFTPHYSPDGSRIVFARCNTPLVLLHDRDNLCRRRLAPRPDRGPLGRCGSNIFAQRPLDRL